jgi:hypothetical protein
MSIGDEKLFVDGKDKAVATDFCRVPVQGVLAGFVRSKVCLWAVPTATAP